jgi:hypothetical protein
MTRQSQSAGSKKGRMTMLIKSQFSRTVVAIAAALAMSSVTVGAAIGPAQASATTGSSVTFMKAPLNA